MPSTLAKVPHAPRRPHVPQNTAPSFVLALSMHALLFGALWFAVQWHTVSDAPAEAQLWDIAPPVQVVEVAPAPPPPPPVVEPQQTEADIVEKQQKVQPKPEPPPPKPVEPEPVKKPPPPKPEPRKEDKKPPPEAKRASDERAEREAEKRRLDEVSRIAAEAGSSTAASGSGTPTHAAGAGGRNTDPSYAGRIIAAVRQNLVFSVPDGTSEQISAKFDVDLLPDGFQAGPPKLIKSSGLPGYDEAVDRAIRRTDPFPRPSDGSPPPRTLHLTFFPIDRN